MPLCGCMLMLLSACYAQWARQTIPGPCLVTQKIQPLRDITNYSKLSRGKWTGHAAIGAHLVASPSIDQARQASSCTRQGGGHCCTCCDFPRRGSVDHKHGARVEAVPAKPQQDRACTRFALLRVFAASTMGRKWEGQFQMD